MLAEARYLNIQNLGGRESKRVASDSILRPTFGAVYNGAELVCPFLPFATRVALVTALLLY